MTTKHLSSVHVRNIKYCVPQMRRFCSDNGFDLRIFMHKGAEVKELPDGKIWIRCGEIESIVDDAQILKLVRSIED